MITKLEPLYELHFENYERYKKTIRSSNANDPPHYAESKLHHFISIKGLTFYSQF